MTLSLMFDERHSFSLATRTKGVVHRIEKTEFGDAIRHEAHCSFVDNKGQRVHTEFAILEQKNGGFPGQLSEKTKQALQRRNLPSEVDILFDPDIPNRNWLADLGWWQEGRERLFHLSLFVLIFQGIALLMFGVAALLATRTHIPWWYDLHRVIPLMMESFWLVNLGIWWRTIGIPFS
jgi:hypothetical protein